MAGEAVHPMAGWDDLRRRLGPDRRVHAFFHPAVPHEPLVVLHAALGAEVPTCMADILGGGGGAGGGGAGARHGCPAASPAVHGAQAEELPSPTVATFYSISNTQPGLSGVDLGNFLIKQVAKRLLGELPTLRTLATLSPLPGFADWLAVQLARGERGGGEGPEPAAPLLLPAEVDALAACAAGHLWLGALWGGSEGRTDPISRHAGRLP